MVEVTQADERAAKASWDAFADAFNQWNNLSHSEQQTVAGHFATHRTEAVAALEADNAAHVRNTLDGYKVADELAAERDALEARVRELEGVLQPFVDIGKQTGAHGVISKKLNGFAPLTVTVTKAQMQRALNAYNARKALHDPRKG